MHILEISKSSSAKTEFSFFSVFFSSVFGFSVFTIPTSVSVSVFKISRYRFRFSVTDSALVCCVLSYVLSIAFVSIFSF